MTSLGGFAINFGSYTLLTEYVPFFIENPFMAFIIGVLMGMGFNFMVARVLVFRELDEEVADEAKGK
jgi:dolichol-phosphate mannosyltransferase